MGGDRPAVAEGALVTRQRGKVPTNGWHKVHTAEPFNKKPQASERGFRRKVAQLEPDLAARLPARKPRAIRSPKGDPIAKQVFALAPELAQLLLDQWPGLNIDGFPDGGYAMARGLVAEVFCSELAWASGMRRAPIEQGGDDGIVKACAQLRGRIRELPLAEVTPDHFGCVHEALTAWRFQDGKLVPSSGRRQSGSHFTPPELARRVVDRTLEPLLKCIGDRSPLVLRVCDPAVGAGAFLLAVVRSLAPLAVARGEATSLEEAKRLVAINCCYGVDKGRFAVHSCKLAMTLEARADRMPSDWLDDNVKHGDALVGLSSSQIKTFHWKPSVAEQPELAALVDRAMADGAAARQARIATLSQAARGAA